MWWIVWSGSFVTWYLELVVWSHGQDGSTQISGWALGLVMYPRAWGPFREARALSHLGPPRQSSMVAQRGLWHQIATSLFRCHVWPGQWLPALPFSVD